MEAIAHGNFTGANVAQSQPFEHLTNLFQKHLNHFNNVVERHSPVSTEVLLVLIPFIAGAIRVLWPFLRTALENTLREYRNETVREIIVTPRGYYESGSLDRNGVLQNAILMYLGKCLWASNPPPAHVWRNKTSEFLLLDPFKFSLYERYNSMFRSFNDSDSDEDDCEGIVDSVKKLDRLVLVRLSTENEFIPIGKSGIEITYSRRTLMLQELRAERTVKIRAFGDDAARRLDQFAQLSLNYMISQISSASGKGCSLFELQAPLSKVLSSFSSSSSLSFKRYTLSSHKNFDTFFFPQRERVMKLLDDFIFRRGRFAIEGFPHKLGFLLYGPCGSGKTAFVKALAAYTGRHVVSVNLALVDTNQHLYDIFLNRSYSCAGENEPHILDLSEVIFLLDDVDAASPLVCSRERRRVVRKRRDGYLTASREPLPEMYDEKVVNLQAVDDPAAAAVGLGGAGKRNVLLDMIANHMVSIKTAGAGGSAETSGAASPAAVHMSISPSSNAVDATTAAGIMDSVVASDMGATPAHAAVKRNIFSMFEEADKLDLSGLLNVLDGTVDTPGRIVVMTTNHPERLDPALVRPGRLGYRVRLDYADFDAISQMSGLYFGEAAPPQVNVMDVVEDLYRSVRAERDRRDEMRRKHTSSNSQNLKADGTASSSFSPATAAVSSAVSTEQAPLGTKPGMMKNDYETEGDAAGLVPLGMAAARIPHQRLSESQLDRLRACVAELEREEIELGGGPDAADSERLYNFQIRPAEVEIMCASAANFEEFLDTLRRVIRREEKL